MQRLLDLLGKGQAVRAGRHRRGVPLRLLQHALQVEELELGRRIKLEHHALMLAGKGVAQQPRRAHLLRAAAPVRARERVGGG